MAEDTKSQPEEGGTPTSREAAWAALGAASREKADAFLEKQGRLVDLQSTELAHELKLRHWSLRVRHVSDVLKLSFELGAALIALLLAGFCIAAVWNASQAEGLVIEAFSVPTAYAGQGIGGDVVASDLTNRLAAIREQAIGYSSAGNVSRDNANSLSVEIPDTGVSLAAVWSALRGWLGHERHLGGNLRAMPGGGLVLTATFDSGDAISVSGRDLASIEQEAAERVFSTFDPTSWFNYLIGAGRYDELVKIDVFASAQDPHTLSDAYSAKGGILAAFLGEDTRGIALMKIGEAYDPSFASPHNMLAKEYHSLGRVDGILDESGKILALHENDQPGHLQGRGFAIIRGEAQEAIARWQGNFADALQHACFGECTRASDLVDVADLEVMQHDGSRARASVDRAELFGVPDKTAVAAVEAAERADVGDWAGVAAQARAGIAFHAGDPNLWLRFSYREQALQLEDWLALAEGNLGDVSGARATLAQTGRDCYPCLIARGDVDAIAKDWGAAEYWYAAAARRVAESPFAYLRWGAMLLHKGDFDGAIAEVAIAHAKGPHFADPLEIWGEALMQKNRSDLALAKFEEANKYAPNWGRLHLKWGEALYYAGRGREAQQQFAAASRLDLSAPDKAAIRIRVKSHG